jgi:hypothetical protein
MLYQYDFSLKIKNSECGLNIALMGQKGRTVLISNPV